MQSGLQAESTTSLQAAAHPRHEEEEETDKTKQNLGPDATHKPKLFPDTMKKRKQTKPNKRKSNKRTKSTKISSLSSPC